MRLPASASPIIARRGAWILAISSFLAQLLRALQRVFRTDENDFHISQFSAIGYRVGLETGIDSKCRCLGENMTAGEQHDRHRASAHWGIVGVSLVMGIIGSAGISSSMGAVAEAAATIGTATSIPSLCFLVIALFARMYLRDRRVSEIIRP